MTFRKTIYIKNSILKPISLDNFELEDVYEEKIENPFKSTVEILDYFKYIATDAPIEELRAFANKKYLDKRKYPLIMDRENLYKLQVDALFAKEGDFIEELNNNDLEKIVSDSFYKDSFHIVDKKKCISINSLETYVIGKAELRAFRELDEEDTQDLKYYWIGWPDDFINLYYDLGYKKIISDLYDIVGYKWFCENAWNDPVKYNYVLKAILCKKSFIKTEDESNILKKDLFSVYENILLSSTIYDCGNKLEEPLKLVKEEIENWNGKELKLAIKKIESLKDENDILKNKCENMEKSLNLLKKQVKEIQKQEINNSDSIYDIVGRVLAITTPISEEKTEYKFNDIWEYLSDNSKKHIKGSFKIFEMLPESIDIAIAPLMFSLESEFVNNYIKPFQMSKIYLNIKDFSCKDYKYKKTHESLIKNSPYKLTIGGIPYIGRFVNDLDACKSSNVIKSFAEFLGEDKNEFMKICKALDEYRVNSQYRLVEIRNAIAHGEDNIINILDERYYNEIIKLLYTTPLEILVRIIKGSMKNKIK